MILWSLLLLPLAGAAVAAMGPDARGWLAGWAVAVLGMVLALAVIAAPGSEASLAWGGDLTLSVTLTPLSHVVAMLVPAVALIVTGYAAFHEHRPGLRRLIAWMLAFAGGMELLVLAGDFLTLLIAWELVGACSWALIGHKWWEKERTASADYAFVVTRTGDVGLFIAALALFAGTGSFAFEALEQLSPGLLALVAAGVLISAAAKSGQVPFSPWLFHAMKGPTSVSALLHSATMVAAGAYLLSRLYPMLEPVGWFGPAVIAIGLATALGGGIVACIQPHAKRLLAGSTSAHYGLMFVAVGAGYPLVGLAHMVAHGFFKSLLFMAVGVAGERAGSYFLRDMRFGGVLSFTAAASIVGSIALAGLPPLGGAWTKEKVIAAAGHEAAWLAILTMVAGALSAIYAARLQLLAFGKGNNAGKYAPGGIERTMLALSAGVTLVLGILWLPGVHELLARTTSAELPPSRPWEAFLSLLLVAGGIAIGVLLARRPSLGSEGTVAAAGDWLGLPLLLDRLARQPVTALSRIAARLDDAVIDRGVRLSARASARIAGLAGGADTSVVDRGVRGSARLGEWLAQIGSGIGERIADGLPQGTADGFARGGRLAMRTQTGMSHHYYAAITGGVIVVGALAVWGTA